MQQKFQGDSCPLARCVKIKLRDGTIYGFTDHDEDLTVDIGDGDGPVSYSGDFGMISGDVELAAGFESSSMDLTIPIRDPITRAQLLGRRFNQAFVWIFEVDWSNSFLQPAALMKAWVADVEVQRNAARLEIRSLQDYFNIVIGRIATPRCTATFGDAKCGVARVDDFCTVTQVISNMEFRVDLAGTLSDGFYRFGFAEFQDGPLAGVWEMEVFDYVDATGLVTMLVPMPGFPTVGDSLILRRGCSNVKSATDPLVPTCLTYNNVRRFRGFDRFPGSDTFFRMPVPGQG
jgi:uncharacterized phage protein (TIGR02218 family)